MLSQTEKLRHLSLASELAGLDVAEVVVATDRHAIIDGFRLHYLDWGNSQGPPLLFLHGGCLTAHTWDLVCLALRRNFHCLAVDQRGHGDSEWSPNLDYGSDAHARDTSGLIAQLGLKRPVLIGQSLGGLNAMTYAASSPVKPAGIVLVDVAPDVQWQGVQRIRGFVTDSSSPGSVEDFVERAMAFNPRRDPRLLRSSLLHNLRQLPDQTWTWKYDRRRMTPEHYESILNDLAQFREGARKITCPVLVIRGADSEVLSDRQAMDFAASLPDGRWVKVPQAAHNVQGDNPLALIRVLEEFLAEINHGESQFRRAR